MLLLKEALSSFSRVFLNFSRLSKIFSFEFNLFFKKKIPCFENQSIAVADNLPILTANVIRAFSRNERERERARERRKSLNHFFNQLHLFHFSNFLRLVKVQKNIEQGFSNVKESNVIMIFFSKHGLTLLQIWQVYNEAT